MRNLRSALLPRRARARRADPRVRTPPRTRGRFTALVRLASAALALLGALVVLAGPARAAGTGTVAIEDLAPKEDNGRWKLKMTINYGSTPHLPHIGMVFSFTPKVHYERMLTDQSPEKPILNRIPLEAQTPINEDMDVGFSDGSGKIFPLTKFDFVIRRDRGFDAGEYELKITRATDGAQMGKTQKITLQGDNPVVDRRAIVFSGGGKKKKDEKKAEGDEKKAEGDEKKAEGDEKKAEAAAPAESAPVEAPPAVEPKQGGCGCRVAGEGDPATTGAAALAALALGAAVARRRCRAKI